MWLPSIQRFRLPQLKRPSFHASRVSCFKGQDEATDPFVTEEPDFLLASQTHYARRADNSCLAVKIMAVCLWSNGLGLDGLRARLRLPGMRTAHHGNRRSA